MSEIEANEIFNDLHKNVSSVIDFKTGSFDDYDEDLIERSDAADKRLKESFDKLMKFYGIKDIKFDDNLFIKTGFYEGESRGIVELLEENPNSESIKTILQSVKKTLDVASKYKNDPNYKNYSNSYKYYDVDINKSLLRSLLQTKLNEFNWVLGVEIPTVELSKKLQEIIKKENPNDLFLQKYGNVSFDYIQTFTKGVNIADVKVRSNYTKELFNTIKDKIDIRTMNTIWADMDSDTLEDRLNNLNKQIIFENIKKSMIVIGIILTLFYLGQSINSQLKAIQTERQNDPNMVNGEDLLYATIFDWYNESTNGCYMSNSSGIHLLNNCSNYYNIEKNRINCSCGELTDTLEKSNCDTPNECLKPYCIGNAKCPGSSKEICSTNNNTDLYKCTKSNINDPNYVKYFYYNNFFLSIVPYYGTVRENYTKMLMEENKPKSNIYKYIIGGVLIIIVLFIILFLYIRMKRKK